MVDTATNGIIHTCLNGDIDNYLALKEVWEKAGGAIHVEIVEEDEDGRLLFHYEDTATSRPQQMAAVSCSIVLSNTAQQQVHRFLEAALLVFDGGEVAGQIGVAFGCHVFPHFSK